MNGFEELKGKKLLKVEVTKDDEKLDDQIIFTCDDGSVYKMYHEQDCCEGVTIDDINGNFNEILNTEILLAEERSNESETDWGSETWTFYTIRTQKGDVDLKWHGESNGYYSESVDFIKAKEDGTFSRW